MEFDQYDFPKDLYYEPNHYWGRLENGLVTVGITDYGQQVAGEVIYFQAPNPGAVVAQGKPFASIESGKWVGQVYAPVSGKIIQINDQLKEDASAINTDPYGAGWLVKIEPSDLHELENLLRAGTNEFLDWMHSVLSDGSEK